MNTTIQTTVPTYNTETGHGDPIIPVEIGIGQGIQIGLGQDGSYTPGQSFPDVYLERRTGEWTVNISPEESEIRVSVVIADDGSLQVRDPHGNIVYEEKSNTESTEVDDDGGFSEFLQDATLFLRSMWERRGGEELGEFEAQSLNDALAAFFGDKHE